MKVIEVKGMCGEGSPAIRIDMDWKDYLELFDKNLQIDSPIIRNCVDIARIVFREGNSYFIAGRPKDDDYDLLQSYVEKIVIKIPKYPEKWFSNRSQ